MKIFRNILGLLLGLFLGGLLNGKLVENSDAIIPLPEGVDPNSMESLMENIADFPPENFIVPFLAHALGTLIGAIIASSVAATSKIVFAWAIGIFFLIGGITVTIMLPAPLWFEVVDLVFAYLPMAFIGGKIGKMINKN